MKNTRTTKAATFTPTSRTRVICGTINGQPLARTPKLRISVTPSDMQTLGWGTLTEFVTYEHVGQHYQDGTGLNPLGTLLRPGCGHRRYDGR